MSWKDKILAYMQEKGLSQSATARLLGIGESTLSRYLNDDYPNPGMIDKKIEELLTKEKMRQEVTAAGDIPFAMTGISKMVMQVLEYARIQRTIGVIYGDAGIGKTRTMLEWAKDKSDVVILTATPAFNSPKAFLKYLARQLRITKFGHLDDIYLDIMERLYGTDKMIIIDEAQHLSLKTIENIRSLQDATGIAVVFIGNELVYTKMIGRQQAEFAQLFSRIGIRKHLLTDCFTEEDVKAVFGQDIDPGTIAMLLNVCRSKYGLRGAIHCFVNAANNNDLSPKGIRAMVKMMGIAV